MPQDLSDYLQGATLGYLGPENTHTHKAAKEFYPQNTLREYASFRHVLKAIDTGEVAGGVFPYFNTIFGYVMTRVMEPLAEQGLYIADSHRLEIHHTLSVHERFRDTPWEDIDSIFAHEVAYAQSRKNIRARLPHVKKVFVEGASEPLRMAKLLEKADYPVFSLSPPFAVPDDFHIIEHDLSDAPQNETDFALILPQDAIIRPEPSLVAQSFLYVQMSDNAHAGVLEEILHLFSEHQINLRKLSSRPVGDSVDNSFFIFTEGFVPAKVIDAIVAMGNHVQLLGELQYTAQEI